jgi:hypothetical protein
VVAVRKGVRMRGFVFTSSVLLGCVLVSGHGTTAQAKTGAGGILLLSYLPEAEVIEENRFWRYLMGQMTDCETTASPVADDGAITLGSGCHPAQSPQAPAPQAGEAGA